MADDQDDVMRPSDIGQKLVVALRSVTDPQAVMQAISDRSMVALRGEITTRIDAMEKASMLWHDDLVRIPTDVQKAVKALEEIVEAKLNTLREADSNSTQQRSMMLGHVDENLRNTRNYVQSELTGYHKLYMEKFSAVEDTIRVLKETINDRFTQNDANTEKAFNAAKQAVAERDASNAASANKSEKNLMDALGKLDDNVKTLSVTTSALIAANKTSTDDKINDVKDILARLDIRISSNESSRQATSPATSDAMRDLAILRLSNATNMGEKDAMAANSSRLLAVAGLAIGAAAIVFAFLEHH